jgi:hypothetical protein
MVQGVLITKSEIRDFFSGELADVNHPEEKTHHTWY